MPLAVVDWVATGTIALAVVGAAAVLVNVVLIFYTRASADAARIAAEASTRLAEEAQLDREASAQPHLTFEGTSIPAAAYEDGPYGLSVSNVGPGPAIAATLYAYFRFVPQTIGGAWGIPKHHYYASNRISIGAGEESSFEVASSNPTDIFAAVHGFMSEAQGPTFVQVVICSDLFGNKFRFIGGEHEYEVMRMRPNGQTRNPDHAVELWAKLA